MNDGVESCVCGNVIRDVGVKVTIRRSPCRCIFPGKGPKTLSQGGIPSHVGPRQYAERKAAGLPIEAEVEKSAHRRVF